MESPLELLSNTLETRARRAGGPALGQRVRRIALGGVLAAGLLATDAWPVVADDSASTRSAQAVRVDAGSDVASYVQQTLAADFRAFERAAGPGRVNAAQMERLRTHYQEMFDELGRMRAEEAQLTVVRSYLDAGRRIGTRDAHALVAFDWVRRLDRRDARVNELARSLARPIAEHLEAEIEEVERRATMAEIEWRGAAEAERRASRKRSMVGRILDTGAEVVSDKAREAMTQRRREVGRLRGELRRVQSESRRLEQRYEPGMDALDDATLDQRARGDIDAVSRRLRQDLGATMSAGRTLR